MPKNILGLGLRISNLNRKFFKGFISPLSLFSIGFLVVSLLVGVYAVSKSNITFDLRKRADVGLPEYSTVPINTPDSTTNPGAGQSCGDCINGKQNCYNPVSHTTSSVTCTNTSVVVTPKPTVNPGAGLSCGDCVNGKKSCYNPLSGATSSVTCTNTSVVVTPKPTVNPGAGLSCGDCVNGKKSCYNPLSGATSSVTCTKPKTVGDLYIIPTVKPTPTLVSESQLPSGCSPCNCNGISTCPGNRTIGCTPPSSCKETVIPTKVPTPKPTVNPGAGLSCGDCVNGKKSCYNPLSGATSSVSCDSKTKNTLIGLGVDLFNPIMNLIANSINPIDESKGDVPWYIQLFLKKDKEEPIVVATSPKDVTKLECSNLSCAYGCTATINNEHCNSAPKVIPKKEDEKIIEDTELVAVEETKDESFDIATLNDGKKWCSGNYKPGQVVIWGGYVQGCNGKEGKWKNLSAEGYGPEALTVVPSWLTPDSKNYQNLVDLASEAPKYVDKDGVFTEPAKESWCNTDSGGVPSGSVSLGGVGKRSKCSKGKWTACSDNPNDVNSYCGLTIVPSYIKSDENLMKDLEEEQQVYQDNLSNYFDSYKQKYSECSSAGGKDCFNEASNVLTEKGVSNKDVIESIKDEFTTQLAINYVYPAALETYKNCIAVKDASECLNEKANLNKTVATANIQDIQISEAKNDYIANKYEEMVKNYVDLKFKATQCSDIVGTGSLFNVGCKSILNEINKIEKDPLFVYSEARRNMQNCSSVYACQYWSEKVAKMEEDPVFGNVSDLDFVANNYLSPLQIFKNVKEENLINNKAIEAIVLNDNVALKEACLMANGNELSKCTGSKLTDYKNSILDNLTSDEQALIANAREMNITLNQNITNQLNVIPYSTCNEIYNSSSARYSSLSSSGCSKGHSCLSGYCKPDKGTIVEKVVLTKSEEEALLAEITEKQNSCNGALPGSLYDRATNLCVLKTNTVPKVVPLGREVITSTFCTTSEFYSAGSCYFKDTKDAYDLYAGAEGYGNFVEKYDDKKLGCMDDAIDSKGIACKGKTFSFQNFAQNTLTKEELSLEFDYNNRWGWYGEYTFENFNFAKTVALKELKGGRNFSNYYISGSGVTDDEKLIEAGILKEVEERAWKYLEENVRNNPDKRNWESYFSGGYLKAEDIAVNSSYLEKYCLENNLNFEDYISYEIFPRNWTDSIVNSDNPKYIFDQVYGNGKNSVSSALSRKGIKFDSSIPYSQWVGNDIDKETLFNHASNKSFEYAKVVDENFGYRLATTGETVLAMGIGVVSSVLKPTSPQGFLIGTAMEVVGDLALHGFVDWVTLDVNERFVEAVNNDSSLSKNTVAQINAAQTGSKLSEYGTMVAFDILGNLGGEYLGKVISGKTIGEMLNSKVLYAIGDNIDIGTVAKLGDDFWDNGSKLLVRSGLDDQIVEISSKSQLTDILSKNYTGWTIVNKAAQENASNLISNATSVNKLRFWESYSEKSIVQNISNSLDVSQKAIFEEIPGISKILSDPGKSLFNTFIDNRKALTNPIEVKVTSELGENLKVRSDDILSLKNGSVFDQSLALKNGSVVSVLEGNKIKFSGSAIEYADALSSGKLIVSSGDAVEVAMNGVVRREGEEIGASLMQNFSPIDSVNYKTFARLSNGDKVLVETVGDNIFVKEADPGDVIQIVKDGKLTKGIVGNINNQVSDLKGISSFAVNINKGLRLAVGVDIDTGNFRVGNWIKNGILADDAPLGKLATQLDSLRFGGRLVGESDDILLSTTKKVQIRVGGELYDLSVGKNIIISDVDNKVLYITKVQDGSYIPGKYLKEGNLIHVAGDDFVENAIKVNDINPSFSKTLSLAIDDSLVRAKRNVTFSEFVDEIFQKGEKQAVINEYGVLSKYKAKDLFEFDNVTDAGGNITGVKGVKLNIGENVDPQHVKIIQDRLKNMNVEKSVDNLLVKYDAIMRASGKSKQIVRIELSNGTILSKTTGQADSEFAYQIAKDRLDDPAKFINAKIVEWDAKNLKEIEGSFFNWRATGTDSIQPDVILESALLPGAKVVGAPTGLGKSMIVIENIAFLKKELLGADTKIAVILKDKGDLKAFTDVFNDEAADFLGFKAYKMVDIPPKEADLAAIKAANFYVGTSDTIFNSLDDSGMGRELVKALEGSILIGDEAHISLRTDVDFIRSTGGNYVIETSRSKRFQDLFDPDNGILGYITKNHIDELNQKVSSSQIVDIEKNGKVFGKGFSNDIREEAYLRIVNSRLDEFSDVADLRRILTSETDIVDGLDSFIHKIGGNIDKRTAEAIEALSKDVSAFNSAEKVFVGIPNNDFGFQINAKILVNEDGSTEKIGAIVPKETNKFTGRQYSLADDEIAYQYLGRKFLGEPVDDITNLKLFVTSDAIETNYGRFLKETFNLDESLVLTATPQKIQSQWLSRFGISSNLYGSTAEEIPDRAMQALKNSFTSLNNINDEGLSTALDVGDDVPRVGVIGANNINNADMVEKLVQRSHLEGRDIVIIQGDGNVILYKAGGGQVELDGSYLFKSSKVSEGLRGVEELQSLYKNTGEKPLDIVYELGRNYGTDLDTLSESKFFTFFDSSSDLTDFMQTIGRDRCNGGCRDLAILYFGDGDNISANTFSYLIKENEEMNLAKIAVSDIDGEIKNTGYRFIQKLEDLDNQRGLGGLFEKENDFDEIYKRWKQTADLNTTVKLDGITPEEYISQQTNRLQRFINSLNEDTSFKNGLSKKARDFLLESSGNLTDSSKIAFLSLDSVKTNINPLSNSVNAKELVNSIGESFYKTDFPEYVAGKNLSSGQVRVMADVQEQISQTVTQKEAINSVATIAKESTKKLTTSLKNISSGTVNILKQKNILSGIVNGLNVLARPIVNIFQSKEIKVTNEVKPIDQVTTNVTDKVITDKKEAKTPIIFNLQNLPTIKNVGEGVVVAFDLTKNIAGKAYQSVKSTFIKKEVIQELDKPLEKTESVEETLGDIFDLYKRGEIINIIAHGIEEEKGGLNNMVSIMVEGIKGINGELPFFGTLVSGDPALVSGPHGPYYVILATRNEDIPTSVVIEGTNNNVIKTPDHKAYIVPDMASKETLENLLNNLVNQGKIDLSKKDELLAKTYTYSEYLSLNVVQPTKEELQIYEQGIQAKEENIKNREKYAREFDTKNNIQYVDAIENNCYVTPEGIKFDSVNTDKKIYLRFSYQEGSENSYLSLINIDRRNEIKVVIDGEETSLVDKILLEAGQTAEFEGFVFRYDGVDKTQSFVRAKVQVLGSSAVEDINERTSDKTFVQDQKKQDMSNKFVTVNVKDGKAEINIQRLNIKEWWNSEKTQENVKKLITPIFNFMQKKNGFFFKNLNSTPKQLKWWITRMIFPQVLGPYDMFRLAVNKVVKKLDVQIPQSNVQDNKPISRALNDSEKELFKKVVNDKNQFELTRDLLKINGLYPQEVLEMNGEKYFFFSKIIKTKDGKGREQALMFIQGNNGKIYPRILYKSKSDGGWRSTEGFYYDGNGKVTYLKGRDVSKEEGHYTQETKPHQEIIKYLESAEERKLFVTYKGDLIVDYFNIANTYGTIDTFKQETSIYDDNGILTEFRKYQPGKYGDNRLPIPSADIFANFEYPKGFLPDFSKGSTKVETTNHTLLGKITLETFEAKLNGRDIEWVFAYDLKGRVWIERINFKDGEISSYGTYKEIINSGALTNKPLEYESQVRYLIEKKDYTEFSATYKDITPLIKNLKPVKLFIEYKNTNITKDSDIKDIKKVQSNTADKTQTQVKTSFFSRIRRFIITGSVFGTITTSLFGNSIFNTNPFKINLSEIQPVSVVSEVNQNVVEPVALVQNNQVQINTAREFDLSSVDDIDFSSWGEVAYQFSDYTNPYELIPDFFYNDILPKIVDSKGFCSNVDSCQFELRQIPVISHINNISSVDSSYGEEFSFVQLDFEYRWFPTINSHKDVAVREDIKEIVEEFMDKVASLNSAYYIRGINGYRSYQEQQNAYSNQTTGDVAKPGYSQHPTGLAIDFDTNIPYEILVNTANKYGFVHPFSLDTSGWSDPPHWFYLDGVYPGLTQMIIDSGGNPNNINVINEVLLGLSQTYEAKISFLTNSEINQSDVQEISNDQLLQISYSEPVMEIYNQHDSKWANIHIDNVTDISDVGCGFISVANIVQEDPLKVLGLYKIGKDITAAGSSIQSHSKALLKLGYETNIGANNNGVLEEIISKANQTNNYSELLSSLNIYLNEGWNVMLNGNFSNLNGGGHWVVITKVDIENEIVVVMDPNGGILKEYSFDQVASSGEGTNMIAPKKVLLARKMNQYAFLNASLIPLFNASMFENLANKYIYSRWPEAREKGILPVLYDGIKNFIEGKKNKDQIIPVTGGDDYILGIKGNHWEVPTIEESALTKSVDRGKNDLETINKAEEVALTQVSTKPVYIGTVKGIVDNNFVGGRSLDDPYTYFTTDPYLAVERYAINRSSAGLSNVIDEKGLDITPVILEFRIPEDLLKEIEIDDEIEELLVDQVPQQFRIRGQIDFKDGGSVVLGTSTGDYTIEIKVHEIIQSEQIAEKESVKYLGLGINWPEFARLWRAAESKAINAIVKKIFGFSASVAEFMNDFSFNNSFDFIKGKINQGKIIPVTGVDDFVLKESEINEISEILKRVKNTSESIYDLGFVVNGKPILYREVEELNNLIQSYEKLDQKDVTQKQLYDLIQKLRDVYVRSLDRVQRNEEANSVPGSDFYLTDDREIISTINGEISKLSQVYGDAIEGEIIPVTGQNNIKPEVIASALLNTNLDQTVIDKYYQEQQSFYISKFGGFTEGYITRFENTDYKRSDLYTKKSFSKTVAIMKMKLLGILHPEEYINVFEERGYLGYFDMSKTKFIQNIKAVTPEKISLAIDRWNKLGFGNHNLIRIFEDKENFQNILRISDIDQIIFDKGLKELNTYYFLNESSKYYDQLIEHSGNIFNSRADLFFNILKQGEIDNNFINKLEFVNKLILLTGSPFTEVDDREYFAGYFYHINDLLDRDLIKGYQSSLFEKIYYLDLTADDIKQILPVIERIFIRFKNNEITQSDYIWLTKKTFDFLKKNMLEEVSLLIDMSNSEDLSRLYSEQDSWIKDYFDLAKNKPDFEFMRMFLATIDINYFDIGPEKFGDNFVKREEISKILDLISFKPIQEVENFEEFYRKIFTLDMEQNIDISYEELNEFVKSIVIKKEYSDNENMLLELMSGKIVGDSSRLDKDNLDMWVYFSNNIDEISKYFYKFKDESINYIPNNNLLNLLIEKDFGLGFLMKEIVGHLEFTYRSNDVNRESDIKLGNLDKVDDDVLWRFLIDKAKTREISGDYISWYSNLLYYLDHKKYDFPKNLKLNFNASTNVLIDFLKNYDVLLENTDDKGNIDLQVLLDKIPEFYKDVEFSRSLITDQSINKLPENDRRFWRIIKKFFDKIETSDLTKNIYSFLIENQNRIDILFDNDYPNSLFFEEFFKSLDSNNFSIGEFFEDTSGELFNALPQKEKDFWKLSYYVKDSKKLVFLFTNKEKIISLLEGDSLPQEPSERSREILLRFLASAEDISTKKEIVLLFGELQIPNSGEDLIKYIEYWELFAEVNPNSFVYGGSSDVINMLMGKDPFFWGIYKNFMNIIKENNLAIPVQTFQFLLQKRSEIKNLFTDIYPNSQFFEEYNRKFDNNDYLKNFPVNFFSNLSQTEKDYWTLFFHIKGRSNYDFLLDNFDSINDLDKSNLPQDPKERSREILLRFLTSSEDIASKQKILNLINNHFEVPTAGNDLVRFIEFWKLLAQVESGKFVEKASREVWKNVFGEEVVNRLLDSLPKSKLADEKRNAFTHNSYDRTSIFLKNLSIYNGISTFKLTSQDLEIVSKFIGEFGLSNTPKLYYFYKSFYLYENKIVESLPEDVINSGIKTSSELIEKLRLLEELVFSEEKFVDFSSLTDFEVEILSAVTGKSTHRFDSGRKGMRSIMDDFEQDYANGEISSLPQGYNSKEINIFNVVSDNEIQDIEDYLTIREEILLSIDNNANIGDIQELRMAVEKIVNDKIQELDISMSSNSSAQDYIKKQINDYHIKLEQIKRAQTIDQLMEILITVNFGNKTDFQQQLNSIFRQLVFKKVFIHHTSPGFVEEVKSVLTEKPNVSSLTMIINILRNQIKDHAINVQINNAESYWTKEAFEAIKNNKKRNNLNDIFGGYLEHFESDLNETVFIENDRSNKIMIIPDRGFIGEMSAYLANVCYSKEYPLLKRFPEVVPFKFIREEAEGSHSFVGSVLVFERKDLDGNPIMIIRAFDVPREEEIDIAKLFDEFVKHLESIAKTRGINKILVAGTSSTISNYPIITNYVVNKYVRGKSSIQIEGIFNFNEYDITNSLYLVSGLSINNIEAVSKNSITDKLANALEEIDDLDCNDQAYFIKNVSAASNVASNCSTTEKVIQKLVNKDMINWIREEGWQNYSGKLKRFLNLETLDISVIQNGLGRELGFFYFKFTGNQLFGNTEAFDPSIEINKLWNTEPNSEERRDAISIFKEQYARQQLGVSELKLKVEEMIRNNPDIKKFELMSVFQEYGKKYRFPYGYEINMIQFINDFQKVRDNLYLIQNNYRDTNLLFNNFFGKSPEGNVQVTYQPLNILFTTSNDNDYLYLLASEHDGKPITDSQKIEEALKTGGFESSKYFEGGEYYYTVVRDETGVNFVVDHEERHVVNDLLDLYMSTSPRMDIPDKLTITPELLSGYVNEVENYVMERTKNEVMAYIKGGTPPSLIISILTETKDEGGLYDYYNDFWGSGKSKKILYKYLSPKQRKQVDEFWDTLIATPKQIKNREDVVIDSLDAYVSLLNKGFSTNEALALLEEEPLYKWPRVAERFDSRYEKEYQIRKAKFVEYLSRVNWKSLNIYDLYSGEVDSFFSKEGLDFDEDDLDRFLNELLPVLSTLPLDKGVNLLRFEEIANYYNLTIDAYDNSDITEYLDRTSFVKNLIESIDENTKELNNVSYLFGPVGKRYTTPFAWVNSGFNSQQVHNAFVLTAC